jgi:hypothetical protein
MTMITQQLKHLNQKTNILACDYGHCKKEKDWMHKKRRSTSNSRQKLEIQVNEQICTNLKFQIKDEDRIYLRAAHYGFKCLTIVRD